MTDNKNNTGNWSTGYGSTGDRSTGNWSTGNWSTNNKSTGHFCTEETKVIRVFNKDCSIEDWKNAIKPNFLYFDLTEWITEDDMTDQEKIDNDTFHTTGGYLKSYDYKEAFQASWDKADEEDRALLFKLPNFNAEVFKDISGIDVDKKEVICAGKVIEIDGKKYKLEEV